MACGCSHNQHQIVSKVQLEPVRSDLGTSLERHDSIINMYEDLNLTCAQFFLNDPNNEYAGSLEQNEAEYLITNQKRLYVHCNYPALLSSGSNRAYNSVAQVLETIKLTPSAAVIHMGYHHPNNLIERIDQLQSAGKVIEQPNQKAHLLLETAAGRNGELGASRTYMRKIIEGIDQTKHLGLCLDTAHLFASGVSHLSNHESVVKVFERYESILPIGLIHLNDSYSGFGSGIDRHKPLGEGQIWSVKENREGLSSIFSIVRDLGIDMVCETNNWFSDQKVAETYGQEAC